MPRGKWNGGRPVAAEIVNFFKQNPNLELSVSNIRKTLCKQGNPHCSSSVLNNFVILRDRGFLKMAEGICSMIPDAENADIDSLTVILEEKEWKPIERPKVKCDRCGKQTNKLFMCSFINTKLYLCKECFKQN
jgi:hypothetical protein